VRAVHFVLYTLVLLPAAASLTACSDPFSANQDLIVLDSVTLAAVNGPSELPTAIDIATANAPSRPELPGEAGEWDLQVRMQGSGFVLVPNAGSGVYRGAGLKRTTRTLEDPGDAPRQSSEYQRTEVSVVPGDVFYVQSRQYTPLACGVSPKYGILKVVSTSAASGELRLAVLSNQSCNDERLVS
jgi:hypothetical protein